MSQISVPLNVIPQLKDKKVQDLVHLVLHQGEKNKRNRKKKRNGWSNATIYSPSNESRESVKIQEERKKTCMVGVVEEEDPKARSPSSGGDWEIDVRRHGRVEGVEQQKFFHSFTPLPHSCRSHSVKPSARSSSIRAWSNEGEEDNQLHGHHHHRRSAVWYTRGYAYDDAYTPSLTATPPRVHGEDGWFGENGAPPHLLSQYSRVKASTIEQPSTSLVHSHLSTPNGHSSSKEEKVGEVVRVGEIPLQVHSNSHPPLAFAAGPQVEVLDFLHHLAQDQLCTFPDLNESNAASRPLCPYPSRPPAPPQLPLQHPSRLHGRECDALMPQLLSALQETCCVEGGEKQPLSQHEDEKKRKKKKKPQNGARIVSTSASAREDSAKVFAFSPYTARVVGEAKRVVQSFSPSSDTSVIAVAPTITTTTSTRTPSMVGESSHRKRPSRLAALVPTGGKVEEGNSAQRRTPSRRRIFLSQRDPTPWSLTISLSVPSPRAQPSYPAGIHSPPFSSSARTCLEVRPTSKKNESCHSPRKTVEPPPLSFNDVNNDETARLPSPSPASTPSSRCAPSPTSSTPLPSLFPFPSGAPHGSSSCRTAASSFSLEEWKAEWNNLLTKSLRLCMDCRERFKQEVNSRLAAYLEQYPLLQERDSSHNSSAASPNTNRGREYTGGEEKQEEGVNVKKKGGEEELCPLPSPPSFSSSSGAGGLPREIAVVTPTTSSTTEIVGGKGETQSQWTMEEKETKAFTAGRDLLANPPSPPRHHHQHDDGLFPFTASTSSSSATTTTTTSFAPPCVRPSSFSASSILPSNTALLALPSPHSIASSKEILLEHYSTKTFSTINALTADAEEEEEKDEERSRMERWRRCTWAKVHAPSGEVVQEKPQEEVEEEERKMKKGKERNWLLPSPFSSTYHPTTANLTSGGTFRHPCHHNTAEGGNEDEGPAGAKKVSEEGGSASPGSEGGQHATVGMAKPYSVRCEREKGKERKGSYNSNRLHSKDKGDVALEYLLQTFSLDRISVMEDSNVFGRLTSTPSISSTARSWGMVSRMYTPTREKKKNVSGTEGLPTTITNSPYLSVSKQQEAQKGEEKKEDWEKLGHEEEVMHIVAGGSIRSGGGGEEEEKREKQQVRRIRTPVGLRLGMKDISRINYPTDVCHSFPFSPEESMHGECPHWSYTSTEGVLAPLEALQCESFASENLEEIKRIVEARITSVSS